MNYVYRYARYIKVAWHYLENMSAHVSVLGHNGYGPKHLLFFFINWQCNLANCSIEHKLNTM